jgi:hypothetical protein
MFFAALTHRVATRRKPATLGVFEVEAQAVTTAWPIAGWQGTVIGKTGVRRNLVHP